MSGAGDRGRPGGEGLEARDEFSRLRTSYLRLKSALRDRATGLYAFPLLFDEVRSLLDEREFVGIVTVEISNVSLVESVYGWQVFDRLLRRAGEVLEMSIGRDLGPDTRLAINGIHGDVFVLFVPETLHGKPVEAESLGRMAGAVAESLAETFSGQEYETMAPRPRFQVGYALLADNPFYRFERLVYQAVGESRRHAARANDRRRLAWSAELKQILSEQKIRSLYQPIVDLEDGSLHGFEALARGPKDSVFEMPRVMFAFSDQVGMGPELDRLCRRVALEGAGGGSMDGRLFLNTLPEGLADPEWLSERLSRVLDKLGLEPSDLVIEVPDRGAQGGLSRLAPEVQRLREAGFRLALDNVGTGYASMEAIAELRPDYLKVDLSLVQGLDGNLLKQELVRSLASLAEKVGAQLVAGGIESAAERDAVRRCGARYGQGHLIAGADAPPRRPQMET
jgi:EAL domain-containing protein (putative c-di-GMP-specific phosphodiesterase class I)/GGDEF domain-containing protein